MDDDIEVLWSLPMDETRKEQPMLDLGEPWSRLLGQPNIVVDRDWKVVFGVFSPQNTDSNAGFDLGRIIACVNFCTGLSKKFMTEHHFHECMKRAIDIRLEETK